MEPYTVASSDATSSHSPSVSVLLDALEQSVSTPSIANGLSQRLLRSLQLSNENKLSFKALNGPCRVLRLACTQARESRKSACVEPLVEISESGVVVDSPHKKSLAEDCWFECMETCIGIFTEFFSSSDDAKIYVLRRSVCVDCLFELFWEKAVRNNLMKHIIDLMKITPLCQEDKTTKLQVCSKYLETFTQVKERENDFVDLSVDLLAGMRDLIKTDSRYYQALFRDGECFLHIVSLLNGNLDEANGEKLVLNVLHTLTSLLANNDTSKFAFKALAGKGYQTLQSLLLDFFQWQPTQRLLDALLDMLVDGKFDDKGSALIKNEDVIILYLNVLQKSSESLQCYGLNLFQQLLRDSISNRASCVRAGMLNLLLDWFSLEDAESVILKITQLTRTIGGHSISGKDIRKIFALLRSERVGNQQKYRSLLLACLLSMLNEKGPIGFFDMNGIDSGIVIRTPVQWPVNKGFSFCCWLRVESFRGDGKMGIFSFMSKNGKGCFAAIGNDGLSYVSLNLKRQCVNVHTNWVSKKWHFICISHSIGRAFWGGSLLRCYVDGELVSSERCSYPKVTDVLTSCFIGTSITLPIIQNNEGLESIRDVFPFFGQIGPIYLLNDALSSEQVQAIYSLGPSYMYAFLENEITGSFSDNPFPSGILDGKDGLASKVSFGLNAQASDGRRLFNVSRVSDHLQDRLTFEADIMVGTQLCSRRLLQQIIYCVGGISVFFPLITQTDRCEREALQEGTSSMPAPEERMTAEVIELIASVLDENPGNQQQMHLLSGFPILGFLLQSIQPKQLNLETLSSLKHLFNVISSSVFAEQLVEDAISSIFLNPHIWLHAAYNVQRELYMFLIQQLDNDPRLLGCLCRLPRVIDIVWNFYWQSERYISAKGSKPLMQPARTVAERPSRDEIHKIRLLLLSLGEMSMRQSVTSGDVKALIAFFETCQDVACIEDVLHMVIRAISQTSVLASFLEQVNLIGGCHIFVNLLQRDYEPIRLLSLQFLGRLLYDIPSEKKGPRFFTLPVGRTKSLSQGHKKIGGRTQPIFVAMADRLFQYPQTDNLRATLFDVLLGGASPKQVLQKYNQVDKQRSKASNSHFSLPQIFVFIFKFLSGCRDGSARIKIISDILDLLDSNPMNVEALMEFGWSAWLSASVKLDVIKDYRSELLNHDDLALNEQHFVRGLFCVVLCHYILSVKGGWQQLEETVNFILLQCEHNDVPYRSFLRDLYEDLIQRLVELSSEDNIFLLHPCRDNVLYLLRLVDEMLVREFGSRLLFPANSTDFSEDLLQLENREDNSLGLDESFQRLLKEKTSRNTESQQSCTTATELMTNERWWDLYDNLWRIICDINGRGPMKMSPKSLATGPSIGQRARGLVESLNVPAAEMAAVVVSGGIGSALSGKINKHVDKAMLLRSEKCPRIVFRLVTLYLCMSSLEKATRCVQQVTSLLPSFLSADDEQSKSRLHLFIGCLLYVRSQYGKLDDGARFHVISLLIRETVSCGKSILATSGMSKDDTSESGGIFKEVGSIQNLIHKDRVLAAVTDETTYMKTLLSDRTRQVQALSERNNEASSLESNSKKSFDDELQSGLKTVLTWDENRRVAVQLSHEEQQQNVTEKWIHMLRSLMDERGPWSATPFPNDIVNHWKLDRTEDSWRRRLKLRRNYHFDERLCHPPSTATETETTNVIYESKSGVIHLPEPMKRFLLKGIRRITDEGGSESCENDSSQSEQNLLDTSAEIQFSELVRSSSDLKDVVQDKVDGSSLEVDTSEVLTSVPCVLITPKRKLAGCLAVMKSVLHFSAEFLVEGTGGSSVFKNFSTSKGDVTKPDSKQNLVKWSSPYESETSLDLESERINQKPLKKFKRHRRWRIGKVKSVHWTRYLLQYTAVEIFFQESVPPVFLNFASPKNAKEVGMLIVSTRNEFLFPKNVARDRTAMISFVDRRAAIEMAEAARDRWRRREITNFEYLMILNTLAGRSYNDLTQYPVFPWVVADYSSETLDFSKASTFRDLSKPVGALDSRRFEIFEDRYHSFSDPDIPSFYYGSHYSSMGSVLYYLLRLEPFTSLHRSLQGGKFDHADRLFHSIEGTYRNCLSNTSDVKELIPEFFYMPEFLVNSNSYHLGVRQDGVPLGDICLPPWAKGSPEMFIARNREALESEYVSSNLHDWIDLIFGHKQRGKPAVEAANIFYYLTYEGAVDVENMEDELQISAIEDQIANFGQTPIQIFRKKHPRRGPPIPIAHPLYFAPASINLTSILPATTNPPSAVLYVGVLDSNIVLVNQGLTLSVKIWLTTQLHSGGNFTFSSSQDPYFGVGSDVLSPRNIGSPLADNVELGSQCFATMQTPLENFLVSCGNWENSFHVISLTDGRVVQSIRHHKDVVSCVAVTADSSIVATGSYDTTVMVWDILRMRTPEKRVKNMHAEALRKDIVLADVPSHILCGHDDIITCLYVSTDLDIVISGSKDGTCVFHTLREGRYIRSLKHPSGSAVSKLAASHHGRIVLYGDDDLSLHLYSINGKHLASSESNGRINCLELSKCGEFLVSAGDQGQVVVRSMNTLEVVRRYSGAGKIITSLTVTQEECFLAGTKDGALLVYSIDNPQHRKPSPIWSIKS